MPTDLLYLALTAFLTGSLWIPYVVTQSVVNGPLRPPNYKDPDPAARPVPPFGKRANRAHMNAVESLAPFAALVLIAHAVSKDEAIAFWAMAFFWLRAIHAVIYLAGIPYARTVIFTLGWISLAVIFWKVALA